MLSIVVPVFNEEESIRAFYKKLVEELKALKQSYEIIFVDDGSTDISLELLKQLSAQDKDIRVYSFRKNLGKAEALTLGFQKAQGELVITLDADLQDNPSQLSKLLAKQREGIDVVCGWRKNRKDNSKMKVISNVFNYVVRVAFGLAIHDYNCGIKLYTKEAAKSLNLYGGLHRFIPVLVHEQGFRIDEAVVEHSVRKFGKSKYGFSKIWKDLPDMFTMLFLIKYMSRPLHFFGTVGGLLFLAGLGIFGYLAIIWFLGESIGRRPLLTFSMLLMLGGLQIFFTGFLAELITNAFNKKEYDFPIKYSTD